MSDNQFKYLKPFVDDVTIYLYYDFKPETLISKLNMDSDEFNSLTSLILSIPDIKYESSKKKMDYNKLKIKGTIYLNYYQKQYYYDNSVINVSYNLQKYNMVKLKQSLKMTIHKTPNDRLKKLKKQHDIDDTIFTNKHERQLFVWKQFFYQSEGFKNIRNKMYNKLSNSFRFAYIDDKFTSRFNEKDTNPLHIETYFEKKNVKKIQDDINLQKFNTLLDQYNNKVTNNSFDQTNIQRSKNSIIDLYNKLNENDKIEVQQDFFNLINKLNNFKKTESRFIPSTARNGNGNQPSTATTEDQPSSSTTWQWTVKSDICSIIDDIKEKSDIKKPVAWKIDKDYLRVKDIKERMLRIPLLGNPTNCRLNPTHLEEKKIHTFCCLLMLSVSYSVPMIRAVNWEIVNKTWMMMLHQYKNIINEDGFWLVNDKVFHGGRLLELVVRIYNLRITQDDDKGLKLFKPGVNNYRTYLEKYFEKMQPFMTPLEVKDGDTIADVIIKESWVHPKSLIDDVVEPFCKNMSVLLGFGDNPKIVYNDYFD